MGMSCSNCKHSIFYPTVGKYKCIKHDCFAEDICSEYKFSADIDDFDGFLLTVEKTERRIN